MTRQTDRLRQAFAYVVRVCEDAGVDPQEIHVGETFGYYELTVQVSTAEDVNTVADALGLGGETEARNTIRVRQAEPWEAGAVCLPLERPGDRYTADRVQVIAYGVGQ